MEHQQMLLKHGANVLTWHGHRQLRRPILSSAPLPHSNHLLVYDGGHYCL